MFRRLIISRVLSAKWFSRNFLASPALWSNHDTMNATTCGMLPESDILK